MYDVFFFDSTPYFGSLLLIHFVEQSYLDLKLGKLAKYCLAQYVLLMLYVVHL